jgi:hypothetical protein
MTRIHRRIASLALLLSFFWSLGAVAVGRCCPGDAAEVGVATGSSHASHVAGHASSDEEALPPCHCLAGSCVGSAPHLPVEQPVFGLAASATHEHPVEGVAISVAAPNYLIPWSQPPPAGVV